jgi:shikimate dehydrogenase
VADRRVAAVIGSPVAHSLSPAIHNAAFAATGLDWTFVALEVGEGDVPAAIAGVRALGIAGLSVTMPHKAAVAATVDRLTPDAAALRAVNCVYRDGEALVGDNTDGGGFLWSLERAGVSVAGGRVCVLGAGGAARAIVRAVAGAGAAEVVVINRSADRGQAASALAGRTGRSGVMADVATADIVVNATPVGMGGDPGSPAAVTAGQVAVDLVYHPAITPFLAGAAAAGATTVGGIGMLVGQAGLAFERWTGERAPYAVMEAAVQTR